MAPRKPGAPAIAHVLRAAATRVKVNLRGKTDGKPPREGWSKDAWDVFDLIPEVGQAITFMANVVSGVRLFVALEPLDPSDELGPAPEGTPGLAEARDVLERLRTGSSHGGLAGLLAASVVNLKVPGEYWLVGEEAIDPDPITGDGGRPESWEVRSTDEVELKNDGTAEIKDAPGAEARKVRIADAGVDDPEAVFLLRVYDRHPRYKALARSSLRAALSQCDELLLLGRCIRASCRRYLAGNGMLAVPSELELPGGPEEGSDNEPKVNRLMQDLAKAMVESMADESNPDSLVPLLLMGPGELLQKLQHITFGTQLDAEVRALVDTTLGRLGSGLDLPIEQLTGIAKVNHWGAWQIDGASWARYGQPTTRLIVESWTEGLLWPMLDEANVDRDGARRLRFWFDPADAIMDPDESKTADELLDHWAIGFEAYRRRKGASEDEAPTEEDLALLERRGSARATPGNSAGPPNDGQAPSAPSSTTNGHKPVTITAASRTSQPLGMRLAMRDRSLRDRLSEAAEAALRRSLERAGARVRSAAQRSDNVSAALTNISNDRVAATLGPSVTRSLLAAQTEDDLLRDGLDGFEDRFDSRVRQAQAQTRRDLASEFDLDPEEVDALEQRQDNDRHEAWAWLAGAMLALGRDRLYNPAPVAPPLGEVDASSTVPTSIIREAMARAGGGMPADDQPAGGVALGHLVMDVWADNGRVVGGWEWVYGDASSRTRPFESHADLDGEQFRDWSDEVLLVQPGDEWLGVTHYQPGDHDGCQCDFAPLDVEDSSPDGEGGVLVDAVA